MSLNGSRALNQRQKRVQSLERGEFTQCRRLVLKLKKGYIARARAAKPLMHALIEMRKKSVSNEVSQMQDSQPVKPKRGRPRGDYTSLVGTVCNRHEILSILEGPRSRGGVKVMAKCPECDKPYATRLRRLRSKALNGCRCVRSQYYRNYMERRLSELRPEVIAGCWVSRRTMTRQKTAAKFGLRVGVVDAAQRKYQTELDALAEDGTAKMLFQMTSEPSGGKFISTSSAAAELGLSIEATQYLIAAAARQISAGKYTVEYAKWLAFKISVQAAEVLSLVADRSSWEARRRRSWHWENELTRDEFRRTRKGELVGEFVRLYNRCKAVDRSLLDESQQTDVDSFLDIAENTLSNRRSRQLAAIQRKRVEGR